MPKEADDFVSVNFLESSKILRSLIWVFDLEQMRLIWASDSALRLLCVSTVTDFQHTDWRNNSFLSKINLDKYLHKLQEGKSVVDNWTLYPNGQAKSLLCLISGIITDPQRLLMVVEAFENPEIGSKILPSSDFSGYSQENTIEALDSENSLQDNETIYRVIAENAADLISRHNIEGVYLYASPACRHLLGYEPEELIGTSAYEYFHTEDLAKIRKSHLTVLETDQYYTVTYRIRKKTGDYIWLESTSKTITELSTGKFQEIICVSRDVTERQRRESLLASQKKILEMIAKNEPLSEVFQAVLLGIEEQCPGVLGSVNIFKDNRIWCVALQKLPLSYAKAVDGLKIGPEIGSCGRAIFRKTPVITEDVLQDPNWLGFRDLALTYGLRACWSLPIISSKGEVFGTFALYFPDKRKPTDLDLEVIETAINLTGIAFERKQTETDLQQAELKYRSIFENINQGIFQTSESGKYLNANPALARIYGYDSVADLQENLTDIQTQLYVDPLTRQSLLGILTQESEITNFECQVYRKDGGIIWISENTRAVYDQFNNFLYFEGTVEDITARRRAEEKLKHQAFYDSLTKLPNRTWFISELELAIKKQLYYSVLFIDLDGFKFVNDSFGHSAGDELIKKVAHRLQISLRSSYKIARFGGDEFSILIIGNVDEAITLAAHIKEQFKYPFQLNDREIFSNFSMGITSSIQNYQKPEEILRDVDLAMYCAKAAGKGTHVVFEPKMQEAVIIRLNLENDLRRAIELQELSLCYQPIMSLITGDLVGFEALLRWNHSTRGWISPADFIPLAEETGLINEIGLWVLQEACRQLQQWQSQCRKTNFFTLNVNISPYQFEQVDIVEQIHNTLEKFQISGCYLKLEITESDFLETILSEPNTVKKLKDLGIGLCIDDFGTGYSSLSRLHEFPIDTLKIDRSFVNTLEAKSGQIEVVRAIINLAHSLDMNVVAEGIETEIQKQKLQELGCELGQGFLFNRPLDSQTATKLIMAKCC